VRNSSLIGRVAAFAAVGIAVVAVAIILLSGGSSYQVKAIFGNASQLVTGDEVDVAGNAIGSISKITLTPGGQAELTLTIDNSTFQPLHQGTLATVRLASLSGIANRYVDLRLGPATAAKIPSGGVIPASSTTSAVDFDQLFNTLDGPTRKGLQNVIQGSAAQYGTSGKQAQAAWQYLNPAVASSSVLFRELNRDTGKFTNFVVKSGKLLGDIAQRQSDLSGLVAHLNTTTQALASQHVALGQSIASKPVAPKLQKLLEQLKPLAEDSVPTIRDLSAIIKKPGASNDLIELTKLGVPLAQATVRDTKANGKVRPGAFPISVTALNGSTPELATARPYAVDLTGWFEGYTHPGTIDANGGASRIAPVVGLGSIQNGSLNIFSNLLNILPGSNDRLQFAQSVLTTGQGDRCPGSMERGALFYPESGFPCNPSQVPTGK
jgi:phospholipid/cholesterol/gamma-HCH transport system substrate-binding protein